MILDLKELKKSGKVSETFFFEYFADKNLSGIPDTEIVGPVRVSGEIVLTGEHSANVSGEASFEIRGNCTRCLAQTVKQYVFEFSELCDEASDNPYPVVNDKIYLDKIIDDTVISDMPMTFLCREDCKGICAGCGVNLNESECKCK